VIPHLPNIQSAQKFQEAQNCGSSGLFIFVPLGIMALTILKCVQILTIAIHKYETRSLSLIVAIIVLSKRVKLFYVDQYYVVGRVFTRMHIYLYIYGKYLDPWIQVLDRVMYSTLEYIS
jgi:hypothetical protein